MFRTLRFYHSFFKFLSTPSSRRATQDQIHHLWRGGHFYPRPPRGGRRNAVCFPADHIVISIHALREEGDESRPPPWAKPVQFLSTPSARRATCLPYPMCTAMNYFYPRPPRGGRQPHRWYGVCLLRFLSTPSARRATETGAMSVTPINISIHALREEGDATIEQRLQSMVDISIHALREEGDPACGAGCARRGDFYPRPPRGGRRDGHTGCHKARVFLSTPSARRATPQSQRQTQTMEISIHALREEGDLNVSPGNTSST